MTDRVNALTVVLDRDIRVDDVEAIANAIRQLRHVADVVQNVASMSDHIAETRAKMDLEKKLWAVLCPDRKP